MLDTEVFVFLKCLVAKALKGYGIQGPPTRASILINRYGAPLCSPEAWAPISMQMYPFMSINPMSVNTPCETSTESSMSLSSHQHPRTSLGNVQWPYYPISGVCSSMCTQSPSPPHPISILKVSKGAKIRNRYNQGPQPILSPYDSFYQSLGHEQQKKNNEI